MVLHNFINKLRSQNKCCSVLHNNIISKLNTVTAHSFLRFIRWGQAEPLSFPNSSYKFMAEGRRRRKKGKYSGSSEWAIMNIFIKIIINIYILLTNNSLISRSIFFLDKITVVHLVNKLIGVFTITLPLYPALSQTNTVHILTINYSQIRLNTTLLSTSISPN